MHFKITKMMDINIGYLYNLNAHFNIGFFFFLEMKSTWKLRSQIFSLAGSIQLKKKRLVYHFLFCFFHSKNKRLWSSYIFFEKMQMIGSMWESCPNLQKTTYYICDVPSWYSSSTTMVLLCIVYNGLCKQSWSDPMSFFLKRTF